MKIHTKTIYLSAFAMSVLLLTACSGPQVRYGDAKAVETINANYGSTDLQMIAEAMTRSLLQSKAISGSKDAPIVTLADVKNKTSEYIDTRVITDKIRTQLMKSGQVRFAVSITEMQNQTDELKRQNQSGLYKNSAIAKTGNMQGAQYRIEGSIASIVKNTKDVKDVYYVFNLNLINNESGLLEWADEKEIRKTATR
ncbi:penicillin-binding protein activator LpoB [Polynucleobacter sp. UB-Raua-W9]|uniref:penicillin-binding protein activator LpoB n=1 Tax=Polynucleobacter sp. UB-Raua-W9 TaxID=1819736 RepID=UPI001BFEA2F2|nr:penicillin-binding protein activator LpoB [Polynucleobacter sp. UB-Raua-W9]QWD73000.1 penicillin-binding protein activator LpoB [Polynucleobacter sp. UB-Raua-W9]